MRGRGTVGEGEGGGGLNFGMGPLQLTVTWYKIHHTGEQATHWDTQNKETSSSQTWGAFFWDYSGIGILGIDGICVLLGAIPFSE